MSGRLKEALRVGAAVYLACLLTSALFVAPFLATSLDFAHTHPEGTPSHSHSIDAILGAGAVTVSLTQVVLVLPLFATLLILPLENPLRLEPPQTFWGRAPPLA